MKNILGLDERTLKNGYSFEKKHYLCNYCGKTFDKVEVFPIDTRFVTASKAAEIHVLQEHGIQLDRLLHMDKKYVPLTDVQINILRLIADGKTDKEIAQLSQVSPSTIRHQRFVLREKAKQAKLYCAIYDTVFLDIPQNTTTVSKDDIIEIHDGAKMVDARYVISEKEVQETLEVMFESLIPLKLKLFPAREKKKIIVLRKIMEQFEKNKKYSEKQINAMLKEIYYDYPTIRRYLIEYGFMDRTKDCTEYWIV